MINLLPELPLPVPSTNPARKPEGGALDFASLLANPPATTSTPAEAPKVRDPSAPAVPLAPGIDGQVLPESLRALQSPQQETVPVPTRVRPTPPTLADMQPACGLSHTAVEPGPRPQPLPAAAEPMDPLTTQVMEPVGTMPTQTQSHPGPALEGRIDLVTLPWRLRANAALSYRSTSVGNMGTGAMMDVARPILEGAPWAGSNAMRWPTFAWINGEWQPTSTLPRPPFLPLPERPGHDWCGSSDPVHAGHAPAWTFWSQRLLRWHPDREGEGVVARVRDFGFDPAQTQSLIDSLLALAEQQDIPLRRIVLNGHEIWRADSSVS